MQVNSTNFTASPTTNFDGNQNLSCWGRFNASYKNLGELSSFSFSVDNSDSGINWTTASDVLVLNGVNGYYAAAHVKDPAPAYDSQTGFAAGNGNTPVPIPAAIWLLGSGLIGLVGLRKRFKK